MRQNCIYSVIVCARLKVIHRQPPIAVQAAIMVHPHNTKLPKSGAEQALPIVKQISTHLRFRFFVLFEVKRRHRHQKRGRQKISILHFCLNSMMMLYSSDAHPREEYVYIYMHRVFILMT